MTNFIALIPPSSIPLARPIPGAMKNLNVPGLESFSAELLVAALNERIARVNALVRYEQDGTYEIHKPVPMAPIEQAYFMNLQIELDLRLNYTNAK